MTSYLTYLSIQLFPKQQQSMLHRCFILLLMLSTGESLVDPANQCTASIYSVYSHYLKKHVISTQTAIDIPDCIMKCSGDLRCKSFNFGFADKSCELSSADRYTHPEDYGPLYGYTYSDNFLQHHKISEYM